MQPTAIAAAPTSSSSSSPDQGPAASSVDPASKPASDAASRSRQNRILRACDLCRKRKIRCDATGGATGPEGTTADEPCTLCTAHGIPCTFAERPVKRPPSKGYVESLERRLEAMEGLLSNLNDRSVAGAIPPPPPAHSSTGVPPATVAPLGPSSSTPSMPPLDTMDLGPTLPQPSVPHTPLQAPSASSRAPSPPPTDLDAIHDLSERLDDLVIQAERYVGRESGLHLVESVHAYVGADFPPKHVDEPSLAEKLWSAEHARLRTTILPLPPPDLAHLLLDAVFAQVGEVCPFMHRGYFEECIRDGLLATDKSFLGLYYAICAIGSRFVDDPRLDAHLALAADDESELRHARGYGFFWASLTSVKDPFRPASLFDLCAAVFQILWLLASTGFVTVWTFVGFAVRRAVDVGAHRESRTRWNMSPMQDQLRRRAFHCLCLHDRFISTALGRPVAIQDDDMDVGVPLDISDDDLMEWERATRAALLRHEPPPPPPPAPGPSIWQCGIEMHRIMSRALKLLYGLKRDKSHEQTVKSVAELDAALNQWLRTIPPRLLWNPARQSDAELQVSAWFMSSYFQTQILVHREFVSPARSRALGFSSLSICSNAARAIANVLDTLRQRNLLEHAWTWAPIAATSSGLVLLLGVFASSPRDPNMPRAVLTSSAASDVKRCINALDRLRTKNFMAGGMYDALSNLARVSASPPSAGGAQNPTFSSSVFKGAAGLNGSPSSSAASKGLKRGNADDWTDGRSPVTEGGSSDRPSPTTADAQYEAASGGGGINGSGGAQQQQHKTRKLDKGLPLSTQDLSCPTFNGRPTFLFGTAVGTAYNGGGGTPAPPPPTNNGVGAGVAGVGSSRASGSGSSLGSLYPEAAAAAAAQGELGHGVVPEPTLEASSGYPQFGSDLGLLDFLGNSLVDARAGAPPASLGAHQYDPASNPAGMVYSAAAGLPPPPTSSASTAGPTQASTQPQPQPQQPLPPTHFTSTDFWSLPLDDPSTVPPAVNAATGEVLSHLGLPHSLSSLYGGPPPSVPTTTGLDPRHVHGGLSGGGGWGGGGGSHSLGPPPPMGWDGPFVPAPTPQGQGHVQVQGQGPYGGGFGAGPDPFGYDATLFGGLSPFLTTEMDPTRLYHHHPYHHSQPQPQPHPSQPGGTGPVLSHANAGPPLYAMGSGQ